jgi:hypothetical protein
MENAPQPQKKKNEVEVWGGIFGITLIVTLLVAGCVYFAYTQYEKIQADKQQLEQPANS